MRGRQASNDQKICKNDEFFPQKSRKLGNNICFIMTFFRIPVRKTSGENSHWNEENTVKMIQIKYCYDKLKAKSKLLNFYCPFYFSLFVQDKKHGESSEGNFELNKAEMGSLQAQKNRPWGKRAVYLNLKTIRVFKCIFT